jgi:hypothetical protein
MDLRSARHNEELRWLRLKEDNQVAARISGVAYAPVFNRTSSYGAEYGYPPISPSPDSSTLGPLATEEP